MKFNLGLPPGKWPHMRTNLINQKRLLLYILEITFSINFAFGCVALALLYAPRGFTAPLLNIEIFMNGVFGIRQTDFITGYWEVLIPLVVFAGLLWLVLLI